MRLNPFVLSEEFNKKATFWDLIVLIDIVIYPYLFIKQEVFSIIFIFSNLVGVFFVLLVASRNENSIKWWDTAVNNKQTRYKKKTAVY